MYLDAHIEVPTLGTARVDIAYGGMFYVLVDAASLGLRLVPDEGRDIVRVGEMVKTAARSSSRYPLRTTPRSLALPSHCCMARRRIPTRTPRTR